VAVEVTLVLRFERESDIPDRDDLEELLDCIVIEMEEEEV